MATGSGRPAGHPYRRELGDLPAAFWLRARHLVIHTAAQRRKTLRRNRNHHRQRHLRPPQEARSGTRSLAPMTRGPAGRAAVRAASRSPSDRAESIGRFAAATVLLAGVPAPTRALQLEFHQLDRRWEHLRVRHPGRQRRLLASLADSGQHALSPPAIARRLGHAGHARRGPQQVPPGGFRSAESPRRRARGRARRRVPRPAAALLPPASLARRIRLGSNPTLVRLDVSARTGRTTSF